MFPVLENAKDEHCRHHQRMGTSTDIANKNVRRVESVPQDYECQVMYQQERHLHHTLLRSAHASFTTELRTLINSAKMEE